MVRDRASRGRGPSAAGPSQRQLRVGELIRRRLAEILARDELHEPELAGVSITVGEVRVSPDLKQATVHVMPLGGQGVKPALAALSRNRGPLRKLVGQALATRSTPELRFRADETFDRLEATRALFADERVRRDVEGGSDAENPSDTPPDGTPGRG